MSKRRPAAPSDLEELHPGFFLVHNPAASPILRGEGEREGDRFRLTSWRREGLIARLRSRGFIVLTLTDQIVALPALPLAVEPGVSLERKLAAGERISYFGGLAVDLPGWLPALPGAQPGSVILREGWVLRRRRGRGPGSYARLHHGTLHSLSLDEALLHGYAQLSRAGPWPVALRESEGGKQMPELLLPTAYRTLLGRFAQATPGAWLLSDEGLALVAALLKRLGLLLY